MEAPAAAACHLLRQLTQRVCQRVLQLLEEGQGMIRSLLFLYYLEELKCKLEKQALTGRWEAPEGSPCYTGHFNTST